MTAATGLPAAVIRARDQLREGRVKLKAQHDSGSPGLQVSAYLTDLIDSVVLDLYQASCSAAGLDIEKLGAGKIALVAHGGYGRRDLAPFSDVDLMLLHNPAAEAAAAELARILSQWLVDAGCQLGFSLRTPPQSCKLAWADAATFTSLVESRMLSGSIELFQDYMEKFKSGSRRRSKKIIQAVLKARRTEQNKYGETVFLLEPNIKRSRGGLRDVQLVRWIGFARYGECELDQLAQLGKLTQEDFLNLKRGVQYLLRLRNQMHFEAGKPQDQLARHLQMGLAEWKGFEGAEGILPVEQFMREYFEFTSEIRYSRAHFVSDAVHRSPIAATVEHSLGLPVRRDFRVGFRHVWASKVGLERVKRDPAAVLELMSISTRFSKPIEHHTWQEIRNAMRDRKLTEIDRVTIESFLELMSRSNTLAGRLRRLHELRVLEQIIPAIAHARCLLQFNQYHKYTVDAHSIRAVECVTELEQSKTTLGKIYRSLANKTILHLALLLHDLGKGYPEDHSEVGARIAAEVADRLKLSAQDKETLVFLVHKHLLLTHTAFRFDLSDDQIALKFAAEVGSSERLELLLLLSYADLASVGPGVVNEWKVNLLLQLYYQTDSLFRDKQGQDHRDIAEKRNALLQACPKTCEPEWWSEQVSALPASYIIRTDISQAVTEVQQLKEFDAKKCKVWGRYDTHQQATEYVVVTRQDSELGTFHRITGMLASQGIQILAAEIHTQPGAIAWDRFLVDDMQYDGVPPDHRVAEVCNRLEESLDPANKAAPVFPKMWSKQTSTEGLETQPTQVRFDNSSSDSHTIITLFAYDHLGLLYKIAKVMHEMELVLHSAKISTHLDQVVDVFYITDIEGGKITESTRLYMIRQRLLQGATRQ